VKIDNKIRQKSRWSAQFFGTHILPGGFFKWIILLNVLLLVSSSKIRMISKQFFFWCTFLGLKCVVVHIFIYVFEDLFAVLAILYGIYNGILVWKIPLLMFNPTALS